KSLFQLMPTRIFTPLDRHFEVLIPPILVKEIVGDLAKPSKDTKRFVSNLANRFGVNTFVLAHYHNLVFHSLAGNEAPMDGRIVAGGMRPVRTGAGKTGHVIEATTEDATTERCRTSSFSLEDEIWAAQWQAGRAFVREKLYFRKLNAAGIKIPE